MRMTTLQPLLPFRPGLHRRKTRMGLQDLAPFKTQNPALSWDAGFLSFMACPLQGLAAGM